MEEKIRDEEIKDPGESFDKDAVLRHYGYDPDVYRRMAVGLWPEKKVYEELPYLKGYRAIMGDARIRVVLDYDPNFPRAMFRIEKIPSYKEAQSNTNKSTTDFEQELQSRPAQEEAIDQLIREHSARFDEWLKHSFEDTQSCKDPSF